MQGKAAVEQLLVQVVEALGRAGLDETICLMEERLLSRPAHELFDTHAREAGRVECHFKPMVELLLRHMCALAARSDRPARARHAEMVAVMRLAGF